MDRKPRTAAAVEGNGPEDVDRIAPKDAETPARDKWSPADVADLVGWMVDRSDPSGTLDVAIAEGALETRGHGDRFLDMVNVAVELSSLEAGKGSPEPGWRDLREALEATGRLVLRIDDDVPASVLVDADRLERVLAALISVASPGGRGPGTQVHVTTEKKTMPSDGSLVLRFEVGKGQAAARREGGETSPTAAPSSARRLGLAACTELVSLTEGAPTGQTREGHAGTFWLTFPTSAVTEAESR